VAAGWMRGIDFIQIPTSLLAMVDSSVGGKTGVNSSAGKNLIGAFKQPRCVIADPELLATMDGREYRAGLAEVLKYGVIRDPAFFSWQEANAEKLVAMDVEAIVHAVSTSCKIKAEYVRADEHERGIRAHLNYGHTFAHALERDTDYSRYLHGEAVGIGMRMAAHLSDRLGLLWDPALVRRQDDLLNRYRLPMTHTSADFQRDAQRLATHCAFDKKAARGKARFIVPIRMGTVEIREVENVDAVVAAFGAGMSPAVRQSGSPEDL